MAIDGGASWLMKTGRLDGRQVRWLGSLEDATSVGTGLAIRLGDVRPVTHQPTGLGDLLTKPTRTGSAPLTKTMGIVAVAALAANAEVVLAAAIMAT
jgi:hypothetical protein